MAARVQEALLEAFAAGTEGLMLKVLDGPTSGYQPSKRSESWIKLKKCGPIAPPPDIAHARCTADQNVAVECCT